MQEKIKLLGLSRVCIRDIPVPFDFGAGYGETWDIPMEQTEKEIENEEWFPFMNYIYPLPKVFKIPDHWRHCLVNTTIVEVNGEYYLSLTGGGMDLSWEICESYIRLGLYPPVHFCNLPKIAGKGKSGVDKDIINACRESYHSFIGWLQREQKELNEI